MLEQYRRRNFQRQQVMGSVANLESRPDRNAHRSYEGVETVLTRSFLEALLERLDDREALVLRGYYFDGRTQADIGGDLGINNRRVSELHRTGLLRLREYFEHRGIEKAPLLRSYPATLCA